MDESGMPARTSSASPWWSVAPAASVRSVPTPGAPSEPAQAHELGARRAVVAEHAEHGAGDHGDAGLAHPARGHAAVLGLDDDGDAARQEHVVDGVGDL